MKVSILVTRSTTVHKHIKKMLIKQRLMPASKESFTPVTN